MNPLEDEERLSRRGFLAGTAGAAAAGASGTALAQDDGGNESDGGNQSEDDGGGGGDTVEIVVGPGGSPEFDPAEVTIAPGTTVVWTWDSDNHNVVPEEQPDDAEWEGHESLENSGFEYEHTFEVTGEYHYICEPHESQGMVGDIIVEEGSGGDGGGGGGGTEEVIVGPDGELVFDPEELTIAPGTTVLWTWDSDNHNVVPDGIPDDAEWEGHQDLENEGFEYEFTFEVTGEYHYICEPHAQSGMVGDIIVEEGAGGGGDGGGGEAAPPQQLVPDAAWTLIIATVAGMVSTLSLAYVFMRYGGPTGE